MVLASARKSMNNFLSLLFHQLFDFFVESRPLRFFVAYLLLHHCNYQSTLRLPEVHTFYWKIELLSAIKAWVCTKYEKMKLEKYSMYGPQKIRFIILNFLNHKLSHVINFFADTAKLIKGRALDLNFLVKIWKIIKFVTVA